MNHNRGGYGNASSTFDDNELNAIRELLSAKEPEIRSSWNRFSTYARKAQGEWLAKLAATHAV